MNRSWILWSAFALCVAVVFGAMGWTTLTVLRLEDNSRRQAVREENVRLALWRMDSAVAPLLAQEAAMPYFAYGAFYPAQRSFADMFAANSNEMVLPSPLLTRGVQHAQLYFQFDPSGEISSPQVPTKGKMDLAKAVCATPEKVTESATRMLQLQALVTREQLLERLPAEAEPEKTAVTFANPGLPTGNWVANNSNANTPPQNAGQTVVSNVSRNVVPQQALTNNSIQQLQQNALVDKDNNDSKEERNQSQAEHSADLLRCLRGNTLRELAWNKKITLFENRGGLSVEAFRTSHWGARFGADRHRGWNGYIMERRGRKLIFGGDTAMSTAFEQLRAKGPFDLAMMPIGSYDPWISAHCTPEQAVAMADAAGAHFILPIHHRTFRLSREPVHEPITRLTQALAEDRIALRGIGETFKLP